MLGYLGNSVVIPFPIKLRPFFSQWSCEWKWLIMVSYHNGTGELELKTISSFAVCYVIYVWHAHVLLHLFSLVLYLFCSCFDMKWINMSLMLHMMLFSIGEIFENPFCIRCQVILFVRRKGVGYLVSYFMLHYRILVWEREIFKPCISCYIMIREGCVLEEGGILRMVEPQATLSEWSGLCSIHREGETHSNWIHNGKKTPVILK